MYGRYAALFAQSRRFFRCATSGAFADCATAYYLDPLILAARDVLPLLMGDGGLCSPTCAASFTSLVTTGLRLAEIQAFVPFPAAAKASAPTTCATHPHAELARPAQPRQPPSVRDPFARDSAAADARHPPRALARAVARASGACRVPPVRGACRLAASPSASAAGPSSSASG